MSTPFEAWQSDLNKSALARPIHLQGQTPWYEQANSLLSKSFDTVKAAEEAGAARPVCPNCHEGLGPNPLVKGAMSCPGCGFESADYLNKAETAAQHADVPEEAWETIALGESPDKDKVEIQFGKSLYRWRMTSVRGDVTTIPLDRRSTKYLLGDTTYTPVNKALCAFAMADDVDYGFRADPAYVEMAKSTPTGAEQTPPAEPQHFDAGQALSKAIEGLADLVK